MKNSFENILLSISQNYELDSEAMLQGIPSIELMENAGAAIADFIRINYKKSNVIVLCGPGNNGGDGFVLARRLKLAGWAVKVALSCNQNNLRGDSKIMASKWEGNIEEMLPSVFEGAELVVDAVFGSGLKREISGEIRKTLECINNLDLPLVSVDVPSGINGDTGEVLGFAPKASQTITFMAKKKGHLLYPAKEYCGQVNVVNIGIPNKAFEKIKINCWENNPSLWSKYLSWPGSKDHKYTRGKSVIVSGEMHSSGAAFLASVAALRIGSGIVGIACPKDSVMGYVGRVFSLLTFPVSNIEDFVEIIVDKNVKAVLVGPGNGLNLDTKAKVLKTIELEKLCVLDADALTVFQDDPSVLIEKLTPRCVITPHEGEFKRIFPKLTGSRLNRAMEAAKTSKCVIVLKGIDTIIASYDGSVVINSNASPSLATAGSGDVLAGLIVGLLAQGVNPFISACCAVWVHSASASFFDAGMIADDLLLGIPKVLSKLRK